MSRSLWVSALVGVATVAAVAAVPAEGASSFDFEYSTGKFVIECTSSGQVCDPPRRLTVRVKQASRVTRITYRAASTHCSSARILVYLGGKRVDRTDWVDAGETTTIEKTDIRLKADTTYRFDFRVEGRTGGCNAGRVGSWGGTIKLKGTH